jgi:hypothetical protein
VTVTGSPYLALTIGSTTRQAAYSSGSGTRFITFRYTTVPGDVDADGITSPTSITQNAGDIVETIQFIIQRTELKVSEVFAEGAFGEEGKDIYEAKPSFKILKDFSPLKDVNSVVDSLFGNKK